LLVRAELADRMRLNNWSIAASYDTARIAVSCEFAGSFAPHRLVLRQHAGVGALLGIDPAFQAARPWAVCRGVPTPKSRPLQNTSLVPIAATIALEMIGPMPGTVISRRQA
jgi:hypothetical protein